MKISLKFDLVHIIIISVVISLASCTNLSRSSLTSSCKYPPYWWQEIYSNDDAPEDWEIMPDSVQCEDGKVILSKRRPLGVFSNFFELPFIYDGKRYASVEGFWQMLKFPEGSSDARVNMDKEFDWKYTREQLSQMSSFEAKKAGDYASEHMKKHSYNWVTFKGQKMPYRVMQKGIHYQIIRQVMVAKLKQNRGLLDLLYSTKGLILLPDHNQSEPTPPAWQYHQILMDIRDLK